MSNHDKMRVFLNGLKKGMGLQNSLGSTQSACVSAPLRLKALQAL